MRLFILFSLLISTNVFAAENTSQTTLPTATTMEKPNNYLARIMPSGGGIGVDFQFRLSDKFSFGPSFAMISNGNGVFVGTDDWQLGDVTTNRQTYGLRGTYYLNSMDVWTPYIAAAATYSQNQVTFQNYGEDNQQVNFNETAYKLMAGYQFVWLHMLTLDVGGGLGYYDFPDSVLQPQPNTYGFSNQSNHLSYALDLAFGLQF